MGIHSQHCHACVCVCVSHVDPGLLLPVEEGVAEGVELPEGLLGVDHQSVAGDDALVLAVHHGDEAVGGRLRADPHPREVLLQQIPGRKETGTSAECHRKEDAAARLRLPLPVVAASR